MGVSSLTSRSVRALGGGLCVGLLEDETVAVAVVSSSWGVDVARSFVSDGRVLSRSCWISFRERERPVPS